MKTRLLFSMITVAIVMLSFSCSGNRNKEKAADKETTTGDATHNSRNSLDYEGTYTGTLPCADCEGIYTEITLKGDNYTMKLVYKGKENKGKNEFTEAGTYTWDESGSIITLNLANDKPKKYQVGENLLFALDQDGKRVTGDLAANYILKKKL